MGNWYAIYIKARLNCSPTQSVLARLFGLFIRGQVVNQYGSQNARLDRFASLDDNPPTFTDQYALINSHLTMCLGNQHLQRCARTWADRIAYTESWRAYKNHYLKEWREIRQLVSGFKWKRDNIKSLRM
jgi:hypothetical protein